MKASDFAETFKALTGYDSFRWHIVQQPGQAKWGDAVVEQLSADLRPAFPDMKGFSRDNVFRMRQLYLGYLEIDRWLQHDSSAEKVGTVSRRMQTHLEDRVDLPELRWSVRELRPHIHSALFLRYMSVKRDPEKCLPEDAEFGDLLPFKDHYVLEFLGLGEETAESDLR